MGDDPRRLYRLDGVVHIAGVINDEELLGVLPHANQIQKFAVNCTWFQETFRECPEGANDETVRRYARPYIMMLLGTQLFADKSGNRIHIIWLPYVAKLEEMGGYSWGSAALAWLYRCMYLVTNRHVVKLAGPLQLLQSWIFWRFPGLRPAGMICSASPWPRGRRRGRRGQRRAHAAVDDHGDHRDDDDDGDQHGPSGRDAGGHAGVRGVSPHHGGHGGEWCGSGMGDGSAHGDDGLGSGPLDDYFVGVPGDEHTLQESQPWRGQMTGTQAPLDVDLNEPPSVPPPDYFALGGAPPSAYAAGSHSVAGPSRAPVGGESVPSGSSSRPLPVQPRPPAHADWDDDEDDIEDEEPLVRRGERTRVPRCCFTDLHLFR
ncbi:hypothetical protein Ahy_A03g016910 [Arachis hypogaea]|uniref:Aminotransferase-like plant mobile domain-containing protein n=1 Tax=Arachis hypogaea TaxID=3818 RepID=A0A445E501_ARAHY|nr:hypothetical protein Ahy_A03g016910 [Arachis hypogaea]